MARDPAEIAKRIEELDRGIKSFLAEINEIGNELEEFREYYDASPIENAASIIAILHFEIVDEYIKPAVHENIDRHKIASITELLIVKVQPLRLSNADEVKQRYLNALLAFTVAASLEMGLYQNVNWGTLELDSASNEFNENFSKIIEDHICYLEMRDPDSFELPIISNSEFWRLVDFAMQMKGFLYFSP